MGSKTECAGLAVTAGDREARGLSRSKARLAFTPTDRSVEAGKSSLSR